MTMGADYWNNPLCPDSNSNLSRLLVFYRYDAMNAMFRYEFTGTSMLIPFHMCPNGRV